MDGLYENRRQSLSPTGKNNGQQIPSRLQFPFGVDYERQKTIIPDAHDTIKDYDGQENTLKSILSHDDDDSVEEEILRPHLNAAAGTPRSEAFASFFKHFVQSKQRHSSKNNPHFPGITDKMTLDGTRETMSELEAPLKSLINELPENLDEVVDFSEGEQAKGSPRSWTPLHYTSQEGNLTLCRAMLEKGAFVDPRNSHSMTPLAFAAREGHLDVCNLLLDFGADPDAKAECGDTPFIQAGREAHFDVAALLLSKGAYIDARVSSGGTLLGRVICYGSHSNKDNSLEVAKFLLENGSDPNTPDNDLMFPLTMAAMSSDLRYAELLLAYNADVNIQDESGKTPLLFAASQNNLEMVQLLLQHGADPNIVEEDFWTALHLSAQHDHQNTLEVVMLLIASKDVDINARTANNVTALHLAVQSNRVDVAECLIAAGADLDAETDNDATALEKAVIQSNLEMINLLLDHGADSQRLDKKGRSLLHAAASQSDVDVLKRLLEEDIDLELRTYTEDPYTALHLAVQNDNNEIALTLLEYGAQP